MKTIKELKEVLEQKLAEADEIFIAPHNDPDFDAIGSAITMSEICNKLKKPSYIIMGNRPFTFGPNTKEVQPGVKMIIDQTQNKYKYIGLEEFNKIKTSTSRKLLIMVDGNKTNRVSLGQDLDYFKDIIIIDHHETDEKTIPTPNMYINIEISSTCEVLANLIRFFNVKIDSYVAAYLLAGIVLDTGRYTRNTSCDTHIIAGKLTEIVKRSLNMDYINKLFMENFESDRKIQDLLKHASFQIYNFATVMNEDEPTRLYTKEELAKTADSLLKYNTSATFALGHIDQNTIFISARSNEGIDVGKIMHQFGGGGNDKLAATEINYSDETITEVRNRLQKILVPGNH